MEIWNNMKTPPQWALKPIQGGRLKGMTDISPIWRYQKMTEIFGPCGIGWKYTIDAVKMEDGSDGQKTCHVKISLYVKHKEAWSDAIPGVGGSMFIANEKNGAYTSDECVKMATTDALSVAMKLLGMGADIYAGGSHDSKHDTKEKTVEEKVTEKFDGTKVALSIETLPEDIVAGFRTLKFNRGEVKEVCESAKWELESIRKAIAEGIELQRGKQ
jgi:hypothetical protein